MAGIACMALPVARLISLEVVEWTRAAIRQRAVIAVPRIVAVVNVAIKAMRSMEPGARPNEQPIAAEPVRAIVAIRGTVIRWIVEVPVGAHRGNTDADPN
jgi:hypothetical protein